MNCPKCGVKTKVWRTERHESAVLRVRICPACSAAFRTMEDTFEQDESKVGAEGKQHAAVDS